MRAKPSAAARRSPSIKRAIDHKRSTCYNRVIMKVIKSVLLCLLSLLLVTFSTTSVSALSNSRKKEYGYNGIFFYDPDWAASAFDCGTLDLTLTGGDNVEKVWNFLVSANISGVSNDPAVIAGIVGNLMTESGANINPFARNAGGCSGIYQACGDRNTNLINYLSSQGITWNNSSQADAALQAELTFMIGESDFGQYTSNLSRVSSHSPSAFAELFLVTFERAVNGDSALTDSGVSAIARSYGASIYYQGTASRRNYAASMYNQFASSTPSSSTDENKDGEDSTTTTAAVSGCSATSTDGQLTFYYQSDEPWGSIPYGSCSPVATISDAGCGPSSLAMVITAFTGQRITPDIVAKKAVAAGHRVCGSGSAWAIATLARDYGLNVSTSVWDENAISAALRSGKMILVAGSGASPFTDGGHFIALRGITSSGKWLIFDSWHKGSGNNTREWEPSEIMSATTKIGTPYVISR